MGLGFLVYMVAAALGITALLFAVPLAYDTLKLAGAGCVRAGDPGDLCC